MDYTAEEKENVMRLLHSNQDVNVELALEIVDSLQIDIKDYVNEVNVVYRWLSGKRAQKQSILSKLKYINRYSSGIHRPHCGSSELPEQVFSLLPNLEYLDFRHNGLKYLSAKIGTLSLLTSLSLAGNPLGTLPESIGQLTSLKHMWLKNTQLTRIPESIGLLSNLARLELQNNHILHLPASLSKLTQLKFLYITNNPLSSTNKQQLREWLPQCIIYF